MRPPHAPPGRTSLASVGRRARLASCAALARCAALAGALLLPGCYALTRATLGEPIPSEQELAAVEPGRTTRAEVLALLGPPDEYSQPVLLAGLSAADSRTVRVLDEHDLFGRDAFTWVRERRDDRAWLAWPVFAHLRRETRIDRLKVLFDGDGVVSAVGCERGIEAP
jgi:hypothetical protein